MLVYFYELKVKLFSIYLENVRKLFILVKLHQQNAFGVPGPFRWMPIYNTDFPDSQ